MTTLARYQVVCPLATGGMAELHLARATGAGGFERLVVVKRLLAQVAEDPERVQMLLDEARIAATLQHTNIVQVHDVEIGGGTVSIVMEYLHGHDVGAVARSARRWLSRGRLPLDQAVSVALGVCAGLHHAHERVGSDGRPLDIVHRDVSPQNVFVTYDGGVKLIDFGIARARSRLGQTDQGVVKGKPGYMSPEQIQCHPVDRRTDVHGAAVLLYELTSGRLPFPGESPYEQVSAMVEQDPPPPSTFVEGYPSELEAMVLRGAARDPADRYATARDMQLELEQFARRFKLDVSQFALAQVMERLFAGQIAAWRAAQEEGRSLADHVAALRMTGMHRAVEEAVAGGIPVVDQTAETRADVQEIPVARGRRLLIAGGLALLVTLAVLASAVLPGSSDPRADPPAPAASPAERTAPPVRATNQPPAAAPGLDALNASDDDHVDTNEDLAPGSPPAAPARSHRRRAARRERGHRSEKPQPPREQPDSPATPEPVDPDAPLPR